MTKIEHSKGVAVKDLIEKRRDAFSKMLPKHFSNDKFLQIIFNEIRRNPKLMDCTAESLLGALFQVAQTGLMPGVLGHCYLIPYGKDVQFQIGYKGLIYLMRNTGEIAKIQAEVVYTNDKFKYELGLSPTIEHEPTLHGDRGKPLAFYAIAHFINGDSQFIVLPVSEVDKIMSKAQAKAPGTPWGTWYDEMGKKSAIKRLAKLMPLSVEIEKKIAQDSTIKRVTLDAKTLKPVEDKESIDIFESDDFMKWDGPAESKVKKSYRKSKQSDTPGNDFFLNGQTQDELDAEAEAAENAE